MQEIDGEQYLTVDEAVALMGIKRATLYAYVSRGLLQSYRKGVGRERLYRRDAVEALLAVRADTPSPRQPAGPAAPRQVAELPAPYTLTPPPPPAAPSPAPPAPPPDDRTPRGASLPPAETWAGDH